MENEEIKQTKQTKQTKICTGPCKKEKTLDNFSKVKKTNGEYTNRAQCKECINLYNIKANNISKEKRKIAKEERKNLQFKDCPQCNLNKPISDFGKPSKTGIIAPDRFCKNCVKKNEKEWQKNNPEKLKEKNLRHREKNINTPIPPEIISKICSMCKIDKNFSEYYSCPGKKYNLDIYCKSCKGIARPAKHAKNKKHNNAVVKQYKTDNRDKINADNREKRRNDPARRLRLNVSASILFHLKKNKGSKNGNSSIDYLPYTIEELKNHIEKQWQNPGNEWMTWENHGPVSSIKQTWQIDHIIPQTALPYETMDHPNFLKCWALENLRPLDAIENVIKGNKIIETSVLIEEETEDAA